MLDQVTREDFEGLAAGALTVELPGGRIALSVVELHDLPPVSPRPRPFAVLRTVSDRADDDAHADFSRFIREVASVYTHVIVQDWLDGAAPP